MEEKGRKSLIVVVVVLRSKFLIWTETSLDIMKKFTL